MAGWNAEGAGMEPTPNRPLFGNRKDLEAGLNDYGDVAYAFDKARRILEWLVLRGHRGWSVELFHDGSGSLRAPRDFIPDGDLAARLSAFCKSDRWIQLPGDDYVRLQTCFGFKFKEDIA